MLARIKNTKCTLQISHLRCTSPLQSISRYLVMSLLRRCPEMSGASVHPVDARSTRCLHPRVTTTPVVVRWPFSSCRCSLLLSFLSHLFCFACLCHTGEELLGSDSNSDAPPPPPRQKSSPKGKGSTLSQGAPPPPPAESGGSSSRAAPPMRRAPTLVSKLSKSDSSESSDDDDQSCSSSHLSSTDSDSDVAPPPSRQRNDSCSSSSSDSDAPPPPAPSRVINRGNKGGGEVAMGAARTVTSILIPLRYMCHHLTTIAIALQVVSAAAVMKNLVISRNRRAARVIARVTVTAPVTVGHFYNLCMCTCVRANLASQDRLRVSGMCLHR